jgi:predicted cation transporter
MLTLIIVLILTAVLPFVVKQVEHHIEFFLLLMGMLAAIISGSFTLHTFTEIFSDKFLYLITVVVLIFSTVFVLSERKIKQFIQYLLRKLPLKLLVFLIITVLGLLSSFITAIVAALLLVEIISLLPLKHSLMIKINIIACYTIGMGSALTPVGGPLSMIVVSKLNAGFFYIFLETGLFFIPVIILLGVLGALLTKRDEHHGKIHVIYEKQSSIVQRTAKIFMFIVALELLGAGFEPIIERNFIHFNNLLLYWVNMLSAILDNATLAAAEISPAMTEVQIKTILLSLIISGGMLITGNIPNIITAGKLKIPPKEWLKFGLPLGIVLLVIGYVVVVMV